MNRCGRCGHQIKRPRNRVVTNAEKLQGRGLVRSPAVSVRTTSARAVAQTTASNQLTKRLKKEEEEVHWATGHAWKQAEAEARGKRLQGNAVVSSSGRCVSAYTRDVFAWEEEGALAVTRRAVNALQRFRRARAVWRWACRSGK